MLLMELALASARDAVPLQAELASSFCCEQAQALGVPGEWALQPQHRSHAGGGLQGQALGDMPPWQLLCRQISAGL